MCCSWSVPFILFVLFYQARAVSLILVVTGDLDPFASVADTGAFLDAVGTSHIRRPHQPDVGHMPYVERRAAEVQDAINELIDGCTAAQSIAP